MSIDATEYTSCIVYPPTHLCHDMPSQAIRITVVAGKLFHDEPFIGHMNDPNNFTMKKYTESLLMAPVE